MNIVKDKLPALVTEELEAALGKHPRFASAHEGYAVLLEETEEAAEELADLTNAVRQVWAGVRRDDATSIRVWAAEAYRRATDLAAEAIQAAAMAQKLMDGLKEMVQV